MSWCWSRLTPPFNPEIIPISLGHGDLYVLAVVINTDYIRLPVMINTDNKVFVRLEGQNQAPDWYRLRDLFAEQAPGYADLSLPPADPSIYTRQGQYPDTDLALRGPRLLPQAPADAPPRSPAPHAHRPSPPSTATTPPSPAPGLLTWSEIWCDVDNSKRFRSSR